MTFKKVKMHCYGDDDFDWEGLDKAIDFIDKNLVRWGRINVRQSKEKFGTARIYCSLGWYQFHSITHPRACFNRYPNWMWEWDCIVGSKIVCVLNCVVLPYHKWLYRTVYQMTCRKYPHLIEEICCMADYVELLTFYKSPWKNEEVKDEVEIEEQLKQIKKIEANNTERRKHINKRKQH